MKNTQQISTVDIISYNLDDNTNSITFNLGDAISGQTISTGAEMWSVPGIISIPAMPATSNPTDAAQVIRIERDDQDIVIATRDVRAQQIAGNLKPGETCIYNSHTDGYGVAKILLKNTAGTSPLGAAITDAIILATKDNGVNTGNDIYLQIDNTAMRFVAPWGSFWFDQTGFHILTASGASFDLGSGPSLPGPLSALATQCNIGAALVNIVTSHCDISNGIVPSSPVVVTLAPVPFLPIPSSPVAVVGAIGSSMLSVGLA